jgi:endonuclease/exonuclease/phosphatase family metal-dependent hydrolase
MEPLDLIDTRLRVATWNVWWQFGPWQERQPAIAETLHGLDADVIALQEVWDTADGTGQAGALADALGYHQVFAAGFDAGDAIFGNAVLSRWPVAESVTRNLPTTATTEEFRVG